MTDHEETVEIVDPAEPSQVPSSMLLGAVTLIRPTQFDVTLETKMGESTVAFAEVLILPDGGADDGSDYLNAGEVPIFWVQVQRQLRQYGTSKWMLSVIRQGSGRSYRAFPVDDPAVRIMAGRALALHRANPKPVIDVDKADAAEGDGF